MSSGSRTVPSETQRTHILHIEYGIGFGGSIISLSELIRGMEEQHLTRSTVVTFQSATVIGKLFPKASVITFPSILSYRTRDRFGALFSRGVFGRLARLPALKAYALVDLLHDAYLARKIARVGRRLGVDLIHANNTWSPSAVQAARLLGVPCVVHFRGFESPNPKSVAERYGRWVEDTVSRCVGISESISESIVAFGVAKERVVTIHNPVTPESYEVADAVRWAIRERHGLTRDHLVVAVFGRITPWKGQLELLEALAPVLLSCPEVRVLIVGDESDSEAPQYGRDLQALARTPENAGRVVLAGYQHEVAAYYAASDIIVHCSREAEPFGRVVIEGMASGKPVVAMAEGGPPEIITDGKDGLLVLPRDADAMRSAILRLRNDASLRSALGREARATVRARFTPEVAATRFLKAIGIMR